MNRPKYVASCSGGKDSVATLLLAAQHNEPLDEAVFSEVMFDQDTSGEVPEHRDFIYDRLKPFCEKELGIKFTILHLSLRSTPPRGVYQRLNRSCPVAVMARTLSALPYS